MIAKTFFFAVDLVFGELWLNGKSNPGLLFLFLGLVIFVLIVAINLFVANSLAFPTLANKLKKHLHINQPNPTKSDIVCQYRWTFPPNYKAKPTTQTESFHLQLQISQTRANQYKNKTRHFDIYRYHEYAQNPPKEVKQLATYLLTLGKGRRYTPTHHVHNVLAFVQQTIVYTPDVSETGHSTDHPQYPLETLVLQKGDCEDQAILAAALLDCMGFTVAVLMCPIHAALGVADIKPSGQARVTDPKSQTDYFYAETTGLGWLPGRVPPKFMAAFEDGAFVALPV